MLIKYYPKIVRQPKTRHVQLEHEPPAPQPFAAPNVLEDQMSLDVIEPGKVSDRALAGTSARFEHMYMYKLAYFPDTTNSIPILPPTPESR
jgi:hypothetical protein